MALVDRVTTNDATDGEIYTWGFNDYGELGLGDCNVRLQVRSCASREVMS